MQSSLAVRGGTGDWTLVNASPDIRAQLDLLRETREPGAGASHTVRAAPFKSVVLIDAQLDHTLGLFSLREGTPLEIHCTPRVENLLRNDLPTFRVLDSFCGVDAHSIPTNGSPFWPRGCEGVRFTAIPQGNNNPRYARPRAEKAENNPGAVIALFLENEARGTSVLYAPALDAFGVSLLPSLARADVLLLDGSFWHDDELERAGITTRRARDMGHWPLGGDDGLVRALKDFPGKRIILTHINNTNPILNEDSPERATLNALGIEVATDGMDIDF
jgi:pyrroloquinoline quinone biosynthesis protein B